MNNNSEIKNITAYKRQRNLCLSKKEKCKIFPQKRFKNGNYYKQKLLDFHQFIPNKQRFLQINDIAVIEEIKVTTSERQFAKTFNEHYVNIAEKKQWSKTKRYLPA